MKLYKDGEKTIRIASCAECPNRQPDYIWKFAGIKPGFTCKAIVRTSWMKGYDGEHILYNPSVDTFGVLYDCPLEDVILGSKNGGSATARTDNG